jgi:VWFA-related protein
MHLGTTVLVVLSAGGAASNSAPGPPVPVFPAGAELVQIDVVVTDEVGAPVRGLRREEFEVLEDGRPQPISHFAVGTAVRPAAPARSATGEPGDPATAAPRGPIGRSIVLVFDDLHLTAGRLSAAKQAAALFVRGQVGPRDEVALVTTSGIRGVSQALTRDREALVRTVEQVTLQDRSARFRFGTPYVSEHQAEQIDRFGERSEAFELAVAQFTSEYFLRSREVAVQMVRERVRSILDEGAQHARASLSALEAAVRSLASLPGRKIVVLVSQGFFLGRGTSYESAYDLRRITDAATRSGVVVYSLDALGLSLPVPGGDVAERSMSPRLSVEMRSRVDGGQDQARREAMRAVAEVTGGFAVLNRNDVGAGLRRILDDNEVYYLLAYEPASPRREGRFRGIEVRLPGRAGFVARTRRGYFEPRDGSREPQSASPSAKKAAEQERERMRKALTSIVPLRGLSVHLSADFIDLPELGPTVVVNAAVEGRSLRLRQEEGLHRGTVDFVGLVSGPDGAVVESFAEKRALALRPETLDEVRQGGIGLSRRLALKPGLYQVRVAALGDDPEERGSASRWVAVPDLAAGLFALSSLFLETASPSPPGQGDLSRARLSFPAGSEVDAVLFAYNAASVGAGATDLAVRFELRSEDSVLHEFQPRPLTSEDPGGQRGVRGGARLSLAGLPPGEYELRARVEDRTAGQIVERGAIFTVE